MAIKTVQTQIDEHKPSEVAESLNNEMQRLDKDVLKALVDIKKRYVKFGGSTNAEFLLTLMFAAEGLTPTWLGGEAYPSSVSVAGVHATASDVPQVSVADIDEQIKLALERAGQKA